MTPISRFIKYLKTVLFYVSLGIILIIYLNNRLVGIYLASIVFVVYLVSFLISLSSKRRLLKIIREYPIISDKEISNKLERPLDDVRNILFSLSKNQKKKKWLIIFLNTRYIFVNERAVENYKQLYYMGYNEKKILEHLQRITRIKSRAEVKAIELTLTNQKRLKNK
ncbi:MAG: hypothetical protein HWN79_15940 [Candidatus Lokiarchaeota archaeon]|nr:hypothetical protein [Candidatus Lokiarchaeota archaeon]